MNMTSSRRKTRTVLIKAIEIGGNAPVSIQSMTNTETADVHSTLDQINLLAKNGCELIRVAVPNTEAADALKIITNRSSLPVIADIHFDYKLAMAVMDNGASKVRINPGNIGGRNQFMEVAHKAADLGIPMRIGVNSGSLEQKLLDLYKYSPSEALVNSAFGFIDALEKINYRNFVVSIKDSDVLKTVEANRLFADQTDYPLHLGITEAGPLETGIIKGAIGIGTLLAEGIGDTIRVSLTASPVEEIRIAKKILQALKLRLFNAELISCPTCGRCQIDLVSLANAAENILKHYELPLTVAVMGCAVNGPGEAREADIGICAGKKKGLLFRKGKMIKSINHDQLLDVLTEELEKERIHYKKETGAEY
jgi:(E)-4-hydroxy-3-methylbut-2-enyl-diphosphate synthase